MADMISWIKWVGVIPFGIFIAAECAAQIWLLYTAWKQLWDREDMDEEHARNAKWIKLFLLFSKMVLGGFTAPFNMIYWESCCCPVSNTAISLAATTQWYGALMIIVGLMIVSGPVGCCLASQGEQEDDDPAPLQTARFCCGVFLVTALICSLCMGLMLQYSSLTFDLAELDSGGVSVADWISLVFIILAYSILTYSGIGDQGAMLEVFDICFSK